MRMQVRVGSKLHAKSKEMKNMALIRPCIYVAERGVVPSRQNLGSIKIGQIQPVSNHPTAMRCQPRWTRTIVIRVDPGSTDLIKRHGLVFTRDDVYVAAKTLGEKREAQWRQKGTINEDALLLGPC
jgi:hypothetical protein